MHKKEREVEELTSGVAKVKEEAAAFVARVTLENLSRPLRSSRSLEYVNLKRGTHVAKTRFGTARAENAQGTPTQSHISPSIPVYVDYPHPGYSRNIF